MAFANSKHLDVRKSTFNDIHGSQNTYYINNFFANPQWDDAHSREEANWSTTSLSLTQESYSDRTEQSSQSDRHENQSFDLRNWTSGPLSESDDRRSPHMDESIRSDMATYKHHSLMVPRGPSRAQTVDVITEAPESIASGSRRTQSQSMGELGQCPRMRAFRTDYRRPSMSFRWYREVPTVVRCIAFSPNGHMVAAGTRDGSVATWSIPDGRQGLPLRKVHKDSVRAIAFHPDGTRLVTASRDTTLLVLSASSGRVLLGPLCGHAQCIISVAISPDGCFIFSGDKAGTLRCWCAKTGAMLPFHYRSPSSINSISFSHDGSWVVCGSARLLFFVWQAEVGKWDFADYTTESFREAKNVSSVAPFPNDSAIVCAAGNCVQMWHAVEGKQVTKEFDMSAKVHSISVSPDGRHFVSGSARGELCICDMRDRKRVATTKVVNTSILTTGSDMDLYAVAFSPDGKYIAGGGAWGLNLYSYRH